MPLKDHNAYLAYQKRYRQTRLESARAVSRAYARAHKTENNARSRQFKKDNRGAVNEYHAARKKAIRRATPKWANRKHIRDIYRASACIQLLTGQPYHVDHIIPITHSLVCGLHVPENLRPLFGPDNVKKKNKFTID